MPMTERSQTCVRVFAVRLFCWSTVQVPVLLTFLAFGTVLRAQTVEIKLVDGRNGHPMKGTCVDVWVGKPRKIVMSMVIPTDEKGVARLRLTDNDGEIDVHNHWAGCGDRGVANPVVTYDDPLKIHAGYVLCQARKSDYSWLAVMDFSTKEVLQHGIATANTCGKVTASPKPGEVVIFVRPLNWWETFKQ